MFDARHAERLDAYRELGQDEPAQADEQLLELVAELSRHDRRTRGHSERVRAYSHMIGSSWVRLRQLSSG